MARRRKRQKREEITLPRLWWVQDLPQRQRPKLVENRLLRDIQPMCTAVTVHGLMCTQVAGAGTSHRGVGFCSRHERQAEVWKRAKLTERTTVDDVVEMVDTIVKRASKPLDEIQRGGRYAWSRGVRYIMAKTSSDIEIRQHAEALLEDPNMLDLRRTFALLMAKIDSMDLAEARSKDIATLTNALTKVYKAINDVELGKANYVSIQAVAALVEAFIVAAEQFIKDPDDRAAYAELVEQLTQQRIKSIQAQRITGQLLSPRKHMEQNRIMENVKKIGELTTGSKDE